MITEKYIKTKKTGRYYSLISNKNKVETLWFVFHGYGQLAKDFILELESIADEKTAIVAPEALNKFYFRGFAGKIAASWMTSEDRENEIEDYVAFIDQIFQEVTTGLHNQNIKINVLGFSQGTHTAVRWICRNKPKVFSLLLWGGSFPRDCNYEVNIDYWNSIKSKIILGTKDKLINAEQISDEQKFLNNQNIDVELIKFNGGHEINIIKLKQIIDML